MLDGAICEGSGSSEFFAIAAGVEDTGDERRFVDLHLGERRTFVHDSDVLVTIDAAKAQLSAEEVARQIKEKQWVEESTGTSVSARASSWTPDAPGAQPDFTERAQAAAVQARPHSFVLGMSIDRLHANKQMQQLLEEVVGQLERVDDVEVDIRIEVTAYSEEGFDHSIERTINENCNTLGIIDAGFSEVR